MDPSLPDAKLDAIRELLPSLASGIRLDVTVAGPVPAETDRAVRELVEHELRLGRGGPDRPDEVAQRADEAASVVAAVLATTPDRVVLLPGPIAALSATLVTTGPAGIALDPGLSSPTAAAVRSVSEAHGLRLAGPPERPGTGTTLVVASHVDVTTGAVLDAPARAREVHAVGGSLLLDMGWSAGALPVDALASRADLVLLDMHRWLLGPEGVTALWASDPATAARVRALCDPLPSSQLLGVARSVGWLLMYLGLPWALERVAILAHRLRTALGAIAGVMPGAAAGSMGASVPFQVTGWAAADVAAELVRRAHVHVEVDEVRGLLLASVGAWTREDEIERFAGAVAEIASHTPETLPRRPLLTVLAPMPAADR